MPVRVKRLINCARLIIMDYTRSKESVQRHVDAYKQHASEQMTRAAECICSNLTEPEPKKLEDAACFIGAACNSTRAIVESVWRHFFLKHFDEWPDRKAPDNPLRDQFEGSKFPYATNRSKLNSRLQDVVKTGKYGSVVDAVETFQGYCWSDADLVWMISNQFKHVSLDLVEVKHLTKQSPEIKKPIELAGGYIAEINAFPDVVETQIEETSGRPIPKFSGGELEFENTERHRFRVERGFVDPANFIFTLISENPNQPIGQLFLSAELHLGDQGEVPQIQTARYIEEHLIFVVNGIPLQVSMDVEGKPFDPFAAISFHSLKRADAFTKTCLDAC